MNIEEAQKKIQDFDKARGWDNDWSLKDLLLNINEETGELWNLIKWIGDEKQKEVVSQNKAEASDFVGDVLFLILKIANQTGVDCKTALEDTLKEYEDRLPAEEIKIAGHTNKLAGGVDHKYNK